MRAAHAPVYPFFQGQTGRSAPHGNSYNLPAQCTIKIFTLDGDLVREINHDFSAADPPSNHDTWDLITRNTQLAVSGLYYWTVESRAGDVQIGKLVLIM